MKSWVLWHKPGTGFEPSIKRVYLDGDRAKEDYELLDGSIWKLDELDVFGAPPAPAPTQREQLANIARSVPPPKPQKPLAEMTFKERCMANPHMVVAWCLKCNAPADDLQLVDEQGDKLTAIVSHHGADVEIDLVPGVGTESATGSIMINAFKADPSGT